MTLQTRLRVISIGIVAENKERDNPEVLITPIEILPFQLGEVKEDKTTFFSKGLDGFGKEWSAQVDVDKTIKATWLSLETNRETPPNLMRGEQVLLWQYADTDKYFYTSMGRDDPLRRLETVVYRWSNEPDVTKDIEALTDENSYRLTISTHESKIELVTNKNNGEPFAYQCLLDTKNGKFTFTDDVDNYLFLDSANTHIKAHNKDTTFFELNKKDINGYAPQDMTFTVDRDVSITVGRHMTFDIGGNYSTTVGGSETVDVKGSISIKSGGPLTVNNPSTKYTTPNTEFTGNVKIGGALNVSGGITGEGTIKGKSGDFKDFKASNPINAKTVYAPDG